MKIHNRGKFHKYSISGCQVKNFQSFAYQFSIHEIGLLGRFWDLPFPNMTQYYQDSHQGLEYIFGKSYFIHTIPIQFPVKKFWFQQFSSFATIDYTRYFRQISTWIFNFDCFSWYHVYLFEKYELNFRMQNLMLNLLAPIWNPKIEKSKKLVCTFLIALFDFETYLIK